MKLIPIVLVLVLMVGLAAGAGAVADKLISRPPAPQPAKVERATLAQELGLSAQQQEQMRTIWEQAREDARQYADDARKFQREYDDSVMHLLTPQQQASYKELSDQAKKRTEELEQKRKVAFKKAVDRSNEILNESQRKTYEQILRNRVGSTGAGVGND
jgi:Spy/CpxP family protein refolding chaperone